MDREKLISREHLRRAQLHILESRKLCDVLNPAELKVYRKLLRVTDDLFDSILAINRQLGVKKASEEFDPHQVELDYFSRRLFGSFGRE